MVHSPVARTNALTMRTSTSPQLVLEPHRFTVPLRGRLLINGEKEQSCFLDVIAGKEAYISTSTYGDVGPCGRAVCYFDLIGRIEGLALRSDADRLLLTISAPDTKWERLRQQFSLVASSSAADRENLRGHRRIVPDTTNIKIVSQDGQPTTGLISNVSRSGAAIKASASVPVGDRVTLGLTRGHVVRSHSDGFAVQFARLLPLESFGRSYRL